MLDKRKSDGKVIEVKEWRGASDVVYSDPDMNRFYQDSDLDFEVEEESEEVTIEGWVARDKKDGCLNLFTERPHRTQSSYREYSSEDIWDSKVMGLFPIDKSLFPSLTWQSDPLPVTITIKAKK